MQTDEQIRATLNRRDRVTNLRDKGESEVKRSHYELERASPHRKRQLN